MQNSLTISRLSTVTSGTNLNAFEEGGFGPQGQPR
jgi:hypothetical protein